ncbi:MAG: AAA family ATPase [Planctomycetota bacterium]
MGGQSGPVDSLKSVFIGTTFTHVDQRALFLGVLPQDLAGLAMSLYDEVSDLHEVERTTHTLVRRGEWKRHGVHRSVLVMQLRPEAAEPHRVARWQHEYRVLSALGGRGAPAALDLGFEQGVPYLVLADNGGVTLRQLMRSADVNAERLLDIAAKIADVLHVVHDRNVVHQDITPDNVVVFGPHDEVQLVNFGNAILISEDETSSEVETRRGSPLYMSPEQTGRVNRVLDSRSDLYSLGVTLYEAFVGVPPFQTADLLEIIHAHLARQPVVSEEVAAKLPNDLPRILLKLLAKSVEDRYQTAFGLKCDLERCLQRHESCETASPFELGLDDDRSRLRLPKKLYGRDEAIQTLRDAFTRVRRGAVEAVFIGGHSGIGKTTLVNQVQRPIADAGGYFVSGKLDQYNRDVPYQALHEAIRGLIRQILVADRATVDEFRKAVTEAVDGNGSLLMEVLPELETVLGDQPPVASLDSAQARERFQSTFLSMLQACGTKDRPLVIFLDDVQWADPPTLELIRALTSANASRHLLLLLAFRDNEVFDGHPVRTLARDLAESDTSTHEIRLENLALHDVTQFVADALSMSPRSVKGLAVLCEAKTSGNPFFLGQLLLSLHRSQLVRYDSAAGCFRWELSEIVRAPLSDNVVDLLLGKLRDLPRDTQRALRLAACLGNKFDLKRLSLLTGTSLRQTAKTLWPAMTERFVLAEEDSYKYGEMDRGNVSPNYRFAHDRLQQAAYCLIEESELAGIHYSVGTSLWRGTSGEELDELVFDIVNHLDVARDFVVDAEERRELIDLTLSAVEKAKRANAFSAALRYITFAIDLIGDEGWESMPALMLQMVLDRAICEHLCGNYHTADQQFQFALQMATSPLQRARVRSEMELLFWSVGKHDQVIESVMTALRELGFDVPDASNPDEIRDAAIELRQRGQVLLGDRSIEDLVRLEEAVDPVAIQAHEHLSHLAPAAFFRNMELYLWLGAKNFELAVRSGNTPTTAFNFSVSGLANLVQGRLDIAYELAQLGVRLSDDYDDYAHRAACQFHFCLINSWKHHYRVDVEHAKRAFGYAIESWNYPYISWSAYAHVRAVTLMGSPLFKVRDLVQQYISIVTSTNRENSAFLISAERMASCLSGKTIYGGSYDSEDFDEDAFVRETCGYENPAPAFNYYIFKLQSLVVLGRDEEAFALLKRAERFESPQWVEATEYVFLRGLTLATRCDWVSQRDHLTRRERRGLIAELKTLCERLRELATQNPENFECRYRLVAAELARLESRRWEAIEHYEAATDAASKNRFLQVEALSQERHARFWLAQEKRHYARDHFEDSIDCFRRWGASRKVDQMLEESRQIWQAEENLRGMSRNPQSASLSLSTPELDVSTIIKASQAISTEIVLDRLLSRMMTVVAENAGATRGVLLLPEDDEWLIGVEWTVDGVLQRDQPIKLTECHRLPHSVVRYVERTRQSLTVGAVGKDPRFDQDPYVKRGDVRSILCIPIQHQGRIDAILYLENELVDQAFAENHVEVLGLLSSQIAISIENAKVYSELEDRVTARTLELAESNRCLRTVFDNAAQGLLLVDLDGTLSGDPPAVLKLWFPGGVPTSLEGFFASDPGAQAMFELAWEQLIQGALPVDVCIDQFPTEIRLRSDRILEIAYRPILSDDDEPRSLLVVISDVTVARQNAKAEIRQRQLMTLFESVSRDPTGIQEFLCESEHLVGQLIRGVSDTDEERRILHTLKGNTAVYGLEEISSLCHELEGVFGDSYGELKQPQRMELAESWLKVRLDIERFMRQGANAIRVPKEDYDRLLSDMEAAEDSFAAQLSLWTLESDRTRLDRIAGQIQELAKRLEKSPVQVELDCGGVYFPEEPWPRFFSALTHIVRNAVDHGLETQQQRRDIGKGEPRITLRSRVTPHGEYVFEIEDDGRGIDWDAIRDKAVSRNLPHATHQHLVDALFNSGLTTRDQATPYSGRGVGLTAVRHACDAMGGRIEVESVPGEGTCWRFRFSASLVRHLPLQREDQRVDAEVGVNQGFEGNSVLESERSDGCSGLVGG